MRRATHGLSPFQRARGISRPLGDWIEAASRSLTSPAILYWRKMPKDVVAALQGGEESAHGEAVRALLDDEGGQPSVYRVSLDEVHLASATYSINRALGVQQGRGKLRGMGFLLMTARELFQVGVTLEHQPKGTEFSWLNKRHYVLRGASEKAAGRLLTGVIGRWRRARSLYLDVMDPVGLKADCSVFLDLGLFDTTEVSESRLRGILRLKNASSSS